MKQSIYKSLFFISLLFGALTSCYNPLSEDVSISSVRRGREFTVVPSMIPMVDALATKSQYTGNDDQVYDWNLFIFEGTSDAAVLCGKYYNSGSSSDMSISFTVKLDAEYTYFAIANVGKQIDNLAGYTTLGALRSARIAISGPRRGLPAATSFTHKFTRSDYEAAQAAHTNLTFPSSINKLTRLVGRYDIVVQKSDLQIWDLDITSLKLYGAGSVTPWVTGSYATQDVELNDADNGGATNQDLYKLNRSEKVSFYPVENMISTPSALSGNTDMWAKVPGNVGNDVHPSYIEMTGTATVNDGSGLSKPVTYRFYLGTDNVKNFEVERNVTHTLTFVPNDETITNGHNGNWKITPGSFTDTRSLMFASNSTTPTSSTNPIRVRAGESLDEAIIRTVGGSPSNFKYNVSFGGQLASDGNMLVRNETSADVAQLNGTTLSSLHLTAKANIDAEGFVKINTIDQPNESPKQDKLYIQIYNAWLEITNDPLVLTYEWNAKQSGSGQNAGFRSSVNWTANPSSGWSVSPVSGSASLTGTSVSIYPDDVNSSTTANKTGQVTLTPDGGVAKTVTVIQKFKPVVTTQPAGLTWTASEGSSDYRELVIISNETWTLTVSPGWTVKDTNGNPVTGGGTSNNGASTSVTVRVYPDGPNVSIPPTDKTGSVVIAPSRGTDDEKATVTLTHQKAAVSLALTENGHDWTWKQKDVDTDNFTFHVTGNLNWSASVSDPDNWRIVSGASGSGNGNVVVRPKAVNSSTSDIKGATLTIQCTDSGVTVYSPTATLRQLVHPNIGLASSGNLQWGWDNTTAQTITLTLSPAGYGWQAALVNGDASHWVMTEDHTDNTISIRPATVNDDVNNAPSIQVRITATDPDDTQSSAVVTCTHNARAAYFDFADPSQQNLSWRWYENASNTVVVNFSTSETWDHTVSSGSSYFSATKNGNSLTIAPVGANTGGARNGAISIEVVGHPELNKTITLAQEARPKVSVAPTGYDWAWTATSADAQSFTVTCTPGYTWSASKTDANNKFSLSGTTGVSDAAFTAGPVGTNEDTEKAYSATIIVTLVNSDDPHAGDITVYVSLSQARKTVFTVLPASGSWTGTDVSPLPFAVTASGSWEVTEVPTGYHLTNGSGTGSVNGTFSVAPDNPNNTYVDQEVKTLKVTCAGQTINVPLQQLAKEKVYQEVYFEVSGTPNFYFHDANDYSAEIVGRYDGDQYDIIADVSNEVDWSYSGDFSPYVESATGNYRVQVHNTSTNPLTGKVSASFSGGEYAGHWVSATSDDQSVSVNAGPYVSASPVNIEWNNTSSHFYDNVSTNESLYEVSGFDSWFTSSSTYFWSASANNGSSPRSSEITVQVRAYDYIDGCYVYKSDTFTITQDGKPEDPHLDHYRYYDLTVLLTAGQYSFTADGGTTMLEASARWKKQGVDQYGNDYGSVINEEDNTFSHFDITSSGSSEITRSGATVTVPVNNSTTSGRSKQFTATYTIDGTDISDSDHVNISQSKKDAPEFSYWRYYDLEVSLNADPEDPNTIAAAGGTSQLSATATWKRVKVYTDGSEPEPYETGICTSITDSRFSVTRTSGSTEFSYDESYGTVSVGENTSTSSRSATFTATFTIGSGLGQASNSDDAKVTQEGAVVMNTYTAAYTVVSVGDTDLKVNETTSVTATLYVGTYTGPATSAPTSFDDYKWDEGTAVEAVSSNKKVFDKVSGTWTAIEAGEATISAVVNYENYHKYFEDHDVEVDVKVKESTITYGDFKVTVSPESISKGESSFASATIQKYVDGVEVGNPIDVTDDTEFSTSSTLVTKVGKRRFDWNGVGIMDYGVTIHGELSTSPYGTHSDDAILTVNKEKRPVLFTFDKDSYVVASDAAVTNTCNFSVKVTYSDASYDYVGSGLIPWSDISINTYSNAFLAGDGDFMAVRANSSREARLFYKGEPQVCTATLTSQNPYELIGINPDISSGEGELYIGFEAEYQYLCQDSAGNMQDDIRVSGIKPTVTPSKISGAAMTCTWAKLSTSDKFYTITSVSTSKYLFEFYYSDAHGNASISYYVTKNGSSSSYDVDPGDN